MRVRYTLDRTPVVTELFPNRGTARGGTRVQVRGRNLRPLKAGGEPMDDDEAAQAEAARVGLNGYACVPAATRNRTGERMDCLTAE